MPLGMQEKLKDQSIAKLVRFGRSLVEVYRQGRSL